MKTVFTKFTRTTQSILLALCIFASLRGSAACEVTSFPWNEDFESLSTTGAGLVPPCWKVQTISGNAWASAGAVVRNIGANTGSKYMYAHHTGNSWLYTPAMQLTGGTTYYFSFSYAVTDQLGGHNITIMAGDGQRADSMQTTLGTIINPLNNFYKFTTYAYTPSTTGIYHFGLHTVAGGSPWYFNLDDVSVSITSPCTITSLPWHEGFESTVAGSGNVPSCWDTKTNAGNNWTSANGVIRSGVGAHTGTRSMYTTYSSDAWMFTPGIQLTGGKTYYFSYYYAVTDALTGYTITTAVGNAQNAAAMTSLGTITDPLNTKHKEALYAYTPPSTGVYHFGIRSNSPTSNPWNFTVDDVSLYTSDCLPPTPLTPAIVNDTTAQANWSCVGCTGSYTVEYGPAATFTTPGTDTGAGPNGITIQVPAGNFSTTLTKLTPGVQYRYFVRQNCGTSFSVNNGSEMVSTRYCTSLYTTGCSASDAIINFTLANLNHANSGCSPAGYGDFTVTQPAIELTSGGTYAWTVSVNYPSSHYVQMWLDANDNGIFETSEAFLATPLAQPNNTTNIPFGSSFTLPASTPGGNHRLRVRIVYTTPTFDACTQYTYGEVQDYTATVTVPSCHIPTSTAASNLNLIDALANWSCFGGCTGSYIIEYGPTATFTTPGTGGTAGTNGTIITAGTGNINAIIAGLANGTTYTYYVRQNCGSGDYSLNSAPQTFTTLARLNTGTIIANQQTGVVTPGTAKVNILRVDIPVAGDTGVLTLNSIKFTSANTADGDIADGGVRLWNGTTTTTGTQIGTNQTFAAGAVTFSGLNLNLVNGTTYYLWLTYDVSSNSGLPHTADAKIVVGDIDIIATKGAINTPRPAALLDPTGEVIISYCSTNLYTTACTGGDEIDSFSIANLHHGNTGCSGTPSIGYANYNTTQPTIVMYRDSTYNWAITNNYTYGHYAQLYIDYNDNGVFTDPGETLLATSFPQPNTGSLPSPNTKIPFGSSITIPDTAKLGTHQFRVRLVWSASSFTSCSQQSHGEVHDYLVLVKDAKIICENKSGQASATLSEVCGGSSTQLSLTGHIGSIQWQQTEDTTTTWLNAVGGGNDTLSPYQSAALTALTYYRAASQQDGCTDQYSNTLAIGIIPSVTPSVTIASADTVICNGGTAAFTATPSGGGTIPSYQWYINNSVQQGTANSFQTSQLTNGDSVYAILTSNALCATGTGTSAAITVRVNALPNVSLNLPATICQSGTPYNLSGTPGGGTYTGTGVTGDQFDASQTPGDYIITYTFTDINTCVATATDTIAISICTAINGIENTVAIYPNPSNGVFTLTGIVNSEALKITDATGRLVNARFTPKTKNLLQIDLSSEPKGIYILYGTSANGSFTQKLVLE